MQLVVEKAAAKALRRMPAKLAASIMAGLEAIALDPFGHHANVKPLEGTTAGFRLRRGDWRILYRVDRLAGAVIVESVKTRGDAYK